MQFRDGKVRVTVLDAACVRIEIDERGAFEDRPSWFAVNRAAGRVPGARIRESRETVEALTSHLRLVLRRKDAADPAERLTAEILQDGEVYSRWRFGDPNRENLGGSLCTLDRLDGPVELEDGVLSRAGWYVHDDSGAPLWDGGRFADRAPGARDYYLFGYGRDYARALRALMRIAGPVPLPRRRAMGLWFSRYWPFTQEDFLGIAREFQQRGLPLDYLVFDMDWHRRDGAETAIPPQSPGWTGWSWNKALIPDPAALLRELGRMQVCVALNSHPHDSVRPHEDGYAAFMRRLGKRADQRETVPLDAGSPEFMRAFFEAAHAPHEDLGVDLWWVDWQQSREMPATRSVPSLSNLKALNHYYFEHSRRARKRGTILSRWAGWGDHRHPMHFSGDAYITWDMLRFQVEMTVSSGNAGCFFWSHDIGGFRGKFDVGGKGKIARGTRNPELFIRWIQFGALSAAMRLHSGLVESLDKRPWLWGEDVLRCFRAMYSLRRRLMPYLYTSAYQCRADGLPLLRPLYLLHPHEEEAYRHPGQFYLGDHVLACPVVAPLAADGRTAPHTVWLPPGRWMDYLTRTAVEGPKTVRARYGLQEFPLFVRCDTLIPVIEHPLPSGMTRYGAGDVSLWFCRGAGPCRTESFWYHDDGESTDFERGAYLLHRLEIEGRNGAYRIRIRNRNASPRRLSPPDPLVLRIHAKGALRLEECRGGEAQWEQEEGRPAVLRLFAAPGFAAGGQALAVRLAVSDSPQEGR